MKDDFSHIDEVFRSGLDNVKIDPPSGLFEHIQVDISSSSTAISQTSILQKLTALSKSWVGISIASLSIITGVVAVLIETNKSENTITQRVDEKNTVLVTKPTIKAATIVPDTSLVTSPEPVEGTNNRVTSNYDLDVVEPKSVQNESQSVHSTHEVVTQELVHPKPVIENSTLHGESVQTEQIHAPINCKGRFELMSTPNFSNLKLIGLSIQGSLAKYEVVINGEKWTGFLGKAKKLERPCYVKKTAAINCEVRAHFMDNCRDTQFITEIVKPDISESEEVLPTVFTPNGDGQNDSFYIKIPTPLKFHLWVVNTRGEVVFETQNISKKWGGDFNGQTCKPGGYQVHYQAEYDDDQNEKVERYLLWLKR
ncbi:MAG: gliding motility-associated C-terminal domain-containing protein [Bacteroidia bacterium]|nr:gliding motility-associated C-terminal domain-containing protein [Bacteroidia bacterium]